MSENNNNKILWAFVAGAAIGAAIGYFLNSSKKDELVADLKEGAADLKNNINEGLDKAKDLFDALKNKDSEAETDIQSKA